ncbi:MAG: hypothetical protein RR248_03790 [Clostridia bacterium]
MNRKLIIVIVLVVFCLSIIVVSVFGIMADYFPENVTATDIYFTDINGKKLELNEEDKLVIEVELDASSTYLLYWIVSPENVTSHDVNIIIPSSYNDIVSVSQAGEGMAIVTFLKGKVPEGGVPITIKCADGSEKSATIMLAPKTPGGGTIDPFA